MNEVYQVMSVVNGPVKEKTALLRGGLVVGDRKMKRGSAGGG